LLAAHRQGLVHRDFKPGNVLVDREGRAHVLDFGLARAAEDDSDWSVQGHTPKSLLGMELTATGHVLGTPAYMAPEQFNGRADGRSDQWSFCVTAYEAFYGARPFQGQDADEMHRVVCEGRIPPPPPQSSVPGWLFKALCRGLSVDPTARFGSIDELLHAMQRDRRSRRIQWMAVAGALGLSAVTAGATAYVLRPQPTAEDRTSLDEIEAQARAAAAEGRFVYPSPDAPNAPTALLAVTQLERLDGPISTEARERADALRAEFAANLAELGDQYWEKPGGMGFASDFYAAALVFDPEQPTARERSTLTPGELSVLRKRAAEGDFSDAELIGAEPLAVLADPDPSERTKKLARLYKKKKTPAASTSLHLERLLGEDAPVFMHRSGGAESESESESEVVEVIEPEVGSGRPGGGAVVKGRQRDRAAAMEEVKAARAALRRGDDAAAEQAFHRALGKDSSTVAALAGLSNIYFERGSFQKALSYGKKAVALSPKNASYRMQLGDVLFKVHRYDDARREYEEAKKLGHGGAAKALKRLATRVGG
jgi:tetratricopeptide (TPR) repeat protein